MKTNLKGITKSDIVNSITGKESWGEAINFTPEELGDVVDQKNVRFDFKETDWYEEDFRGFKKDEINEITNNIWDEDYFIDENGKIRYLGKIEDNLLNLPLNPDNNYKNLIFINEYCNLLSKLLNIEIDPSWENHQNNRKIIDHAIANLVIKNLKMNKVINKVKNVSNNINGKTPDYVDIHGNVLEIKIRYRKLSMNERNQIIDKVRKYYNDPKATVIIVDMSEISESLFDQKQFRVVVNYLYSYQSNFMKNNYEERIENTVLSYPCPEDLKYIQENFNISIDGFTSKRIEEASEVIKSITPLLMSGEDTKKVLNEYLGKNESRNREKAILMTKLPLNVKTEKYVKSENLIISEHSIDCLLFRVFNDNFDLFNTEAVLKYNEMIKQYTFAKLNKTLPEGINSIKSLERMIEHTRDTINKDLNVLKLTKRGSFVLKLESSEALKVGIGLSEKLRSNEKYLNEEDKQKMDEIMMKKYIKLLKLEREIKVADYSTDIEEFFNDCIMEPDFDVDIVDLGFILDKDTDDFMRWLFVNHWGYIKELIKNNKYIRALMVQREILESINANYDINIKNRKEGKMVRCNVFYIKSLKLGVTVFPPTSTHTGAIQFIGCCKEYRMNNDFNKLNVISNTNGYKYFISKPCSIPKVQLTDVIRNFCSGVGMFIAWDSLNMKPNGVLMSLFLEPFKELTNLLDINFYLLKNGGYTLGKVDLTEKVEEVKVKRKNISTFMYTTIKNYERLYPKINLLYTRSDNAEVDIEILNFRLVDKIQHAVWAWTKNNMTKEILKETRILISNQFKKNIKFKDNYNDIPETFNKSKDYKNFFNRKYDFKLIQDQIYDELENGDKIFNNKASFLPGATTEINKYIDSKYIYMIPEVVSGKSERNDIRKRQNVLSWSSTNIMVDSIESGKVKSVNVTDSCNWNNVVKEKMVNKTIEDLKRENKKEKVERVRTVNDYIKQCDKDMKEWEENMKEYEKKLKERERINNLEEDVFEEMEDDLLGLDGIDDYFDEELNVDDLFDYRGREKKLFDHKDKKMKKKNYRKPAYFGIHTSKVKTAGLFKIAEMLSVMEVKKEKKRFSVTYDYKNFPRVRMFEKDSMPALFEILHNLMHYDEQTVAKLVKKEQISGEDKRIFSVMDSKARLLHKIADEIGNQVLKNNKHSNITIGGHHKFLDFQKLGLYIFNGCLGITEDASKHGERVLQEAMMESALVLWKRELITKGQCRLLLLSAASMFNRKVLVPDIILQGLKKDKSYLVKDSYYNGTMQSVLLEQKVVTMEKLIDDYSFNESTKFFKDQQKIGFDAYTKNPCFSSFIGFPLGVMSLQSTVSHSLVGQTIEVDSIMLFGFITTVSRQHSDDSFDIIRFFVSFILLMTYNRELFGKFLKCLDNLIDENRKVVNKLEHLKDIIKIREIILEMKFAKHNEVKNEIIFPTGEVFPLYFWPMYCISQRLLLSRMLSITPSFTKYNFSENTIEMVQVQITFLNNSKTVDVLSPMNKHIDSLGAVEKCYSYNSTLIQRAGVLMEAGLHDMPSKLLYRLMFFSNFASAYDFRIKTLMSNAPPQFFGIFFVPSGFLYEFGLNSNFMRVFSLNKGRNMLSYLLSSEFKTKSKKDKEEEITKNMTPIEKYIHNNLHRKKRKVYYDREFLIDEEEFSSNIKTRDFIMRFPTEKSLKNDEKNLLKFGDFMNLDEMEDYIIINERLKLYTNKNSFLSKLLTRIKSSKSSKGTQGTLRNLYSRKLGYANSLVEWGGKAIKLKDLYLEAQEFELLNSPELEMFKVIYSDELIKFNNITITLNREKPIVKMPMFVGQYEKVFRKGIRYGDWDLFEPFLILAMEIEGKFLEISFDEYSKKDLIGTETFKAYPQIKMESQAYIFDLTKSMLIKSGYNKKNLTFSNMSRDYEFIKGTMMSKLKPLIIKCTDKELLLINKDNRFYSFNEGLNIKLSYNYANVVENDKKENFIMIPNSVIMVVCKLLSDFPLLKTNFFVNDLVINNENYTDILKDRFKDIMNKQRPEVVDFNLISYSQLVGNVYFGAGRIPYFYKETNKLNEIVIKRKDFRIPIIVLKNGMYVGVGYGYHVKVTKKNGESLIQTTDKIIAQEYGINENIFIVTNQKTDNLNEIMNMARCLSYFCSGKLKDLYNDNKGLTTVEVLGRLTIKNRLNSVKIGQGIFEKAITRGEVIVQVKENTAFWNKSDDMTNKAPVYYLVKPNEKIYSKEGQALMKFKTGKKENIILNTRCWLNITTKVKSDLKQLGDFRDYSLILNCWNSNSFPLFLNEMYSDFLGIKSYYVTDIKEEDMLFCIFYEGCCRISIGYIFEEWLKEKNHIIKGGRRTYWNFFEILKKVDNKSKWGITTEVKFEILNRLLINKLTGFKGIFEDKYCKFNMNMLVGNVNKEYTLPNMEYLGDKEVDKNIKDFKRKLCINKLLTIMQVSNLEINNHPIYNHLFLNGFWRTFELPERLKNCFTEEFIKKVDFIETVDFIGKLDELIKEEENDDSSSESVEEY